MVVDYCGPEALRRYYASESATIFDRVVRVVFVETKPTSISFLRKFRHLAQVELVGLGPSQATQELVDELEEMGAQVVTKGTGFKQRFVASFQN